MLRMLGISLAHVSSPPLGLVPVHIGQPEPGSEHEQALLVQRRHDRERGHRQRALRVPGGLNWPRHGLQPRWLGMETSDCAVALEPGQFHSQGADERDRFLAGARRRGELALVVAAIGDVDDDRPRSVLSRFDSSVSLSNTFTSVSGRRLPAGTRPEPAPELSPADRDLALRLLNRPPDAPWWSLHLGGTHLVRGDGTGSVDYEAEGQLQPILVDALGDPVVAAWTPPDDSQRWYIIPDGTDWTNLLGWLIHHALPEYVPNALRRARSPHFVDPDLQTPAELAARHALAELEKRYTDQRLRLQQDLRQAEVRAEPIRYGLLYGTGAELVRTVAAVLTAAGLNALDLDAELDGTRSADLLVSARGQQPRLLEVKAASGAASEDLVGHLQRHLDTWPQLRPGLPVAGGILVVNHQHKRHPSERPRRVYTRPEFVATLTVTVLSTVELLDWWRVADWAAIHTAVLSAAPSSIAATAQQPDDPLAGEVVAKPHGWWRRRRTGTPT